MNPDRQSEKFPKELAKLSDGGLLRCWKDGNLLAADIIVARYAARLISMVGTKLNQRYRVVVDSEDIVQSALGSFFHAVRGSRIQVSQSISLWRLLATFAKRKMLREIERQQAVKRGGEFDQVESQWLETVAAAPPQSQDADLMLAGFSEELPAELLPVFERAVAGFTQREIANRLGVSERTVRRKIVLIQELLGGDEKADSHQTSAAGQEAIVFDASSLEKIHYGQFVLGRMIGAGGFGKVYRATMQTSDQQQVAVKFLRKAFWSNSGAKQMLLREVEQAAKIDHPAIVEYLGWGESPHGGTYLVMQLIDGQPLADKRDLSIDEFSRHLVKICKSIREIHDHGITHGDLTPANILVSSAGQHWVTDFGFSQSWNSVEDSQNRIAIVGGTLGFAAPEQLDSAWGPIGFWTDAYSLGGLAFWYLTGHAPHRSDSVAGALASSFDHGAAPLHRDAGVTPAKNRLARFAVQALEKTVAKRPTIADLMELLEG